MKADNFIRLPASVDAKKHAARWYYNPETNQQISRWQYQTLQHQGVNPLKMSITKKAMGIKDKAQRRSTGYSKQVAIYKRKTAEKLGIKPSQVKVRGNSAEAVAYRSNIKKLNAFNKRMQKLGKKPHMFSPAEQHELERLLLDLNFRDENSQYPPGQSPVPEKAAA